MCNNAIIKDPNTPHVASLHYLVKSKCQETSDNQKETSHLAINFNLILMIILIFVTVNIHNILLWLNAGMEMPVPIVNDILNNALFHSSQCIRRCIKSFTSCTFVLWTRC